MAATGTSRSTYITEVRLSATKLLQAIEELTALQKTWTYGMGSWLTDDDFQGENAGLTVAQITPPVGNTLDAIKAVLDAGHGTNLETVRL